MKFLSKCLLLCQHKIKKNDCPHYLDKLEIEEEDNESDLELGV